MEKKDKIFWVFFGVSLFVFILVLLMFVHRFNVIESVEVECLENVASSYCQQRGWVSLGIEGNKESFRCGETRRKLWANGYGYNFLEEERNNCKSIGKRAFLMGKNKNGNR